METISMKKIILPLFTVFFICFCASAQFKAGDVLLGGNLSFGTTSATPSASNGYTNNSAISINPTVGVFKSEKTVYSFGIIYGHSSNNFLTTTYGVEKATGNNYGLNISKQCFKPIAKNVYFTFAGTITGIYYDNKITYDQNAMYETDKSAVFSFGMSPGISYKLSKRLLVDVIIPNVLAIDYSAGTHHYVTSNAVDNKATRNSFGFSSTLNNNLFNDLLIGFRVLLGK